MTLQIAADPVPLYLAEEGAIVRVVGTRVSLDSIVAGHLRGGSAEQIADAYPGVGLANVHAVLAYYFRHQDEVLDYLVENMHAHVPTDVLRRWEADPEYQAFMAKVQEARGARTGEPR